MELLLTSINTALNSAFGYCYVGKDLDKKKSTSQFMFLIIFYYVWLILIISKLILYLRAFEDTKYNYEPKPKYGLLKAKHTI